MVHVNTSLKPPVLPARGTAAPTRSTATNSSTATDANTTAPDFQQLFSGKTYPVTTNTSSTPAAPTAESVFGPNPWVTNPTAMGPNGAYGLNPYYFATPQTAATVAQMVGGTVVQANSFTGTGGPFQQQQPNLMVQLPNGKMINPGLVASFYTHGYSQSYVDMMVTSEVNNA